MPDVEPVISAVLPFKTSHFAFRIGTAIELLLALLATNRNALFNTVSGRF
jgi:hypothetical protein